MAMRSGWALYFMAGFAALTVATPAFARVDTDCPLAGDPYSSRTPLLDLLINPAAKVILYRNLGPLMISLPSRLLDTTPPSFGAIITPREVLALSGAKDIEGITTKHDADLRVVKSTPETVRARCARYDQTPPIFPAKIKRPAMLVFDKINGFRDAPSIDSATSALKAIAARRGWTLVFSANGAVFNAHDLQRFDAVIWNNVSGDALTLRQRRAFRSYLEKGGGFVGIHGSGGDPFYAWDWYADALIGARFSGHPMTPQFQTATVRVENSASAITRGLGTGWSMLEEWYSFKTSPRVAGAHILASLDETTYDPTGYGGMNIRMGDHPIAWTRCVGDGRSFYTAVGHRPESYTELHAVALLERGIVWASGRGSTTCSAGREIKY